MVASDFAPNFTPKARSDLINRHHDYLAKGDDKRHKASQQFFEKLGMLAALGAHEVHSLLSNTCKMLMTVHQSYDNFYNEPPFAERLLQLSEQVAIPDTAKDELVEAVITCATGNRYGVSNGAMGFYQKMIKNFSPGEVAIMLSLPRKSRLLNERLTANDGCRIRFKSLVKLVNEQTVPAVVASLYTRWTS